MYWSHHFTVTYSCSANAGSDHICLFHELLMIAIYKLLSILLDLLSILFLTLCLLPILPTECFMEYTRMPPVIFQTPRKNILVEKREDHKHVRLVTFNGLFKVYILVAVWIFYAPTYTILCRYGKLSQVVYCSSIDQLYVTQNKINSVTVSHMT